LNRSLRFLKSWEREPPEDLVIVRDRVIEQQSLPTCSRQVEQQGYAIVPNVVTPEEAQELARHLEGSALPRSRAGIRHLLSHPAVMKVANDLRMLGVAQSILGDKAFPFKATLFDKSPDTNWLITWHQDTALPLREKHEISGWGPWSIKEGVAYAHAPAAALEKVIALRLHLDDSTNHNGPLRVVPCTHRKGVLSDQEVEIIVSNATPINCLVSKGGVIVMRPLIIHASSKSHSDISRRVLHLEYASCNAVPAPLQLAVA
jgi:ectoine hydroxylase-related dioxygenase (phytanoyl-CoA dioxygenase family)